MPPFFDPTPFVGANFDSWIRDGDLVVAAGVKSGTSWMCYCAHAVRTKGSDKVGLPFTDIMYTTPWPELVHKPGQRWSEAKDLWNTTVLPDGSKLKEYWDNDQFPFRVFKSHFAPIPKTGTPKRFEVLPITSHPKVKFLAMVRDGVEVAPSLWTHREKFTDEFRSLWGGFPPRVADPTLTARDMLPGGHSYSYYFGYVKAWWPFRNEPNVLLLHYADAVKYVRGTVRRLAEFLDVSLAEAEVTRVIEKCSFKHMKDNGHMFDYQIPFWPGRMFKGGFVNKGRVDGGGSAMAPEFRKEWVAAVQSEFQDPDLRRWASEGGGW